VFERYRWCHATQALACLGGVWPAPSAQDRFGIALASRPVGAVSPAPPARFGAAPLPNPSLERDLHRHGTWPARRFRSSSASRAKRHTGSGPSAQTLGLTQHPLRPTAELRKHPEMARPAMSIPCRVGGPDFPQSNRSRPRYLSGHKTTVVSPGDPVFVSFAPPSEGRLLSKSR
jgi:hypothetical protein